MAECLVAESSEGSVHCAGLQLGGELQRAVQVCAHAAVHHEALATQLEADWTSLDAAMYAMQISAKAAAQLWWRA
jgi:hypothetical protein